MRIVLLAILTMAFASPSFSQCTETCTEIIKPVCPSPGEPDQCYDVIEELCTTSCDIPDELLRVWIQEDLGDPALFPGSIELYDEVINSGRLDAFGGLPSFDRGSGIGDYGTAPDGLGGDIGDPGMDGGSGGGGAPGGGF